MVKAVNGPPTVLIKGERKDHKQGEKPKNQKPGEEEIIIPSFDPDDDGIYLV